VIVSSRPNRDSMRDLAREKRMRSGNLRGNTAALDDVIIWRRPELVFDRFLELDLGRHVVQLWHFGPGNGPGDTIVYAPTAKAAWTGNFLGRAGIAPMLLEGGPRPYIASLEQMKATLDVDDVLVPGHGPLARGGASIDAMLAYLGELDRYVRASAAAGKELQALLDERHIRPIAPLAALAHLVSPRLKSLDELNRNMDRLNVLATWRALEKEAADRA
jgi:cyclase